MTPTVKATGQRRVAVVKAWAARAHDDECEVAHGFTRGDSDSLPTLRIGRLILAFGFEVYTDV